jgi:hypothetical protein
MHGDHHVGKVAGVAEGAITMGQRATMFVIAGMLLGTLLRIRLECILFVFFNLCGTMRFGAVIIAGAFFIWGNT